MDLDDPARAPRGRELWQPPTSPSPSELLLDNDGPSCSSLLEKSISCPICLEVYTDVMVTPCGHSFCYKCITEHVRSKCVCPSCTEFISYSQVVPNFALDDAIKTVRVMNGADKADVVSQMHFAMKQGMTLETVTQLLDMLTRYKDELEVRGSLCCGGWGSGVRGEAETSSAESPQLAHPAALSVLSSATRPLSSRLLPYNRRSTRRRGWRCCLSFCRRRGRSRSATCTTSPCASRR
jgi:hypothetical protein